MDIEEIKDGLRAAVDMSIDAIQEPATIAGALLWIIEQLQDHTVQAEDQACDCDPAPGQAHIEDCPQGFSKDITR